MLKLPNGTTQFSPKDLITFLEGDFAAWMERHAAEGGKRFQPDESDAEADLIIKHGLAHEAAVLARLRERHGSHLDLTKADDREAATLAAMRAREALIYQGRLGTGNWHGYPDFLVRTELPSNLGSWSYEPWDSKLARSPKPYFIVQLCAYADYLEHAQGALPPRFGFVFGNGLERTFETRRFFYFYRHLVDAFLAFQAAFDPAAMPDPALERSFGNWSEEAERILEERDDPWLVARITRSQIKRLRDAGITTAAALAAAGGPVRRMSPDVLARLRRQARLQIASRDKAKPDFEILPHEPGARIGLALLPPPSPGDVYLDLEGNPLAEENLDYLFGAVTIENGTPAFHDWWAHDYPAEKRAFESVVDWIVDRRRRHPGMHVYHYAPYEVTAFTRMMGKYATRERETDDFLRGDVFVDLYAVTRNGVAVGTPSYSLKDVEKLCAPARTAAVGDAASSVAEYYRWLGSGEPADWRDSPILSGIRDYNREDCENTWRLAEWLRARQREAGISWIPQPEPEESGKEAVPEDPLVRALIERADAAGEPPDGGVIRLMAWLLEYHRREDKPMWWRFFSRLEMTAEELYDDADCLANVTRTATPPVQVKKSQVQEFAFDPEQDTKLEAGDPVHLLIGTQQEKYAIESLDPVAGRLTIKFGPKRTAPDTCHIIPNEYLPADKLVAALHRVASAWADGAPERYQAAADMVHRRPPRLRGTAGATLLPEPARFPEDLTALVTSLDQGTLCIQGPPGAGKTHNAAAVIVALASAGKRIGVASNSHKAILNLLHATVQESRTSGRPIAVYKVGSETADELGQRITGIEPKHIEAISRDPGVVIGGSAWAFSREELDQRFDYLFIDEAGQVPLANAIAMGTSARNIVLIGDQMQLSQPAQAVHPGRSGWSCLHYFLEGHATVPPDLGVLLPTTWRLHPDICRFISETAYDGRLLPNDKTARRCLIMPNEAALVPRGTGIVLDEVEHEGNTQSSEEEAGRIAEIVAELRRSRVQDEDGSTRAFDVARDLLIVAPYNAQVRCLKEHLPDPAIRIASVDKFQGQEATVVIVSMSASSLDETPRGPGFLLNPNRLNVAISRARCLAIVVASSRLMRTRPNSVQEMELLNLYCRLRFYARELAALSRHAPSASYSPKAR